ncbi:hypothetical protein SUGI_0704260 [Cryptomeria japonica]|nr:hypothetical protein SUGI_0704260 [Cryptomeria japonica]
MGKSSLMIQTEAILLKKAAQLAFPGLLATEQFPGCRQIEQSTEGQRKFEQLNKAMKKSSDFKIGAQEKDDPLLHFLNDKYREEHRDVYKSLAVMDRTDMFKMKDKGVAAESSSNEYLLRKIPTILTARYNACYYQNQSEAWAGLAVETTKAIEESMTTAQRVRCHWRYAWRKQRNTIWMELFLPCLLALFLSGWLAWVLWKTFSKSNNNDLVQLTYGSIPITILLVVWTVMKQFLSVIKPVRGHYYFEVNLILAACDINVVLGMDEKMIAKAMKRQFPDNKEDQEELNELTKKYLSKIVQLPLALPDTSEDETKNFLRKQRGSRSQNLDDKVAQQASSKETGRDEQFQTEKRKQIFSKLSPVCKPFTMFKIWLKPDSEDSKEIMKKRKSVTVPLNFQRLMTNYSEEESQALDDLSEAATGERRLHREWKRFLTCHRVAWNILSQSETVKRTPGWQMQLVVWLFCCWQWEHQISDIIKDWKKIVPVNGFFKDGNDCVVLQI